MSRTVVPSRLLRVFGLSTRLVLCAALVSGVVAFVGPPRAAVAQSSEAWQSVVGVVCKMNLNVGNNDFAIRCNYGGSDIGQVAITSGSAHTVTPDADDGMFVVGDTGGSMDEASFYAMDLVLMSSTTPTLCAGLLNHGSVSVAGVERCAVARPHTWPLTITVVTDTTPEIPSPFGLVGGGTTTTSSSTTTTTVPPADGGGSACTAVGVISMGQALALIEADGRLTDTDDQGIMLAIMTAESGRNVGIISPPNHTSPPGLPGDLSRDHGLMQLNDYWQARFFVDDPFRPTTDPLYNVSSAITIFLEWGNWNAWTTYTSGAFTAYTDAAAEAVLDGPDSLPAGCTGDGTTDTDDCDGGGLLDIGQKLKCAILSALRFLFVPQQSSIDNLVQTGQGYTTKVPFSIATDVIGAGADYAGNVPVQVAAHRDDCFPLLDADYTFASGVDVDQSVEVCAGDTAAETSGIRDILGIAVYVVFAGSILLMAIKAIGGSQ